MPTLPLPTDLFAARTHLGTDLAIVVALVLVAWLIHRVARPIARRMVGVSHYTRRASIQRPERRQTLESLVADIISTVTFIVAGLIAVQRLFNLSADTIFWTVGLFSAAFGFGARPLISDILSGMGFIFEDTFAVGEKVGMKSGDQVIEGVIEAVNIRTTLIRAPTGELCIVPNGEIRVIRNYSRGRFSPANIKIHIRSTDLATALPILEALGREAAETLPELIEPWQIISETGEIAQDTELTLVAKARFGTGADLRPRLLALVHDGLAEAGLLPED
jgi:small-conductance mechanosensitive channel